MAKYLPLPDGSSLKVPDDMTYEEAMSKAQAKFPDLFAPAKPESKPETGFFPALQAGFKGLKSDIAALAGRTGIMTPEAAEEYRKQQEKESAQIFKPTEEGWTEAPITKIKELLGQSLPYMAAPIAAGATAATLPVTGTAATVAGLGAVGTVSALQFTGSNLSRQVKEGKKLADTDLGAAALASIPQAALDVVSFKMIPGVRRMFSQAGKELTAQEAKTIAEQGLRKTAIDYTASTGKAMGTEGLTESAQQFFERLQAGLSLTDADAQKEYFDQFIGGAVLGGTIAPVGRYRERGRETAQFQAQQAQQEAQARQAQEAAAEAEATQPARLLKLDDDFQAAKAQMQALQQAAKKPGKDATDEQMAAYEQAKLDFNTYKNDTFVPLREEYEKRLPMILPLRQQRAADQTRAQQVELAAAQEQPAVGRAEVPQAQLPRLMDVYGNLDAQSRQLEDRIAEAVKAQDTATIAGLVQQRENVQAQLAPLQQTIEAYGGTTLTAEKLEKELTKQMTATQDTVAKATKALTKAADEGNFVELPTLAKRLDEAKKAMADLQARAEQQRAAIAEQQANQIMRGQTRPLFTEEQAPVPAPEVEDVTPPSPVKGMATTPAEARPMPKVPPRPRNVPVTPDLFETAAAEDAREAQARVQEVGQTRPLFTEEQAPVPPAIAAKPEEAISVPAAPEAAPASAAPPALETLRTQLAAAQAELPAIAKTGDKDKVYEQTTKIGQLRNEIATLEQKAAPAAERPDLRMLDLFSDTNIIRTAINNGDTRTIKAVTDSAELQKRREDSQARSEEQARVTRLLDERLNLSGRKVTRTVTPDEYEKTMAEIDRIKGSIENKQGNAARSVLQRAVDAYAEKEHLQGILDKGVVELVPGKPGRPPQDPAWLKGLSKQAAKTPGIQPTYKPVPAARTLQDKATVLKAALGKGEIVTTRPLSNRERYFLQRKIDAADRLYTNLTNNLIVPARDRIFALYQGMHQTEEVKKPSEIRAEKAAEAEARARAQQPITRAAQVARRIEQGRVQPEVEGSATMRKMALDLGTGTAEYKKTFDAAEKQGYRLREELGPDSKKYTQFIINTKAALENKAMALGRAAPEYKAALKKRVEAYRESLATAGKQVVPSKRTPQVTRKATGAPSQLRGATPESRMQGEERHAALRRMYQDFKEAVQAEGTDYGDGNFRSGGKEGVDLDEAQKTIDKLKLPEGTKFIYARTLQDAPKAFFEEAAAQKIPFDELLTKKGVVLKDGTIVIVGEHHDSIKDLEQTVAHELIGHYGVQGLLGEKGMKDLFARVEAQEGGLLKLADTMGVGNEVRAAIEESKRAGDSDRQAAFTGFHELIAYTEEQRITESLLEKGKRWLQELIGAVRAALQRAGLTTLGEVKANEIFNILREARADFNAGRAGAARGPDGGLLFRSGKITNKAVADLVAEKPDMVGQLKANVLGLGARQKYVDGYASIEEAVRKGVDAKRLSSLEGDQAMYYLRFGENRSQYVGQAVTNGPLSITKNKTALGDEFVFKSTKGANLMKVAELAGKAKLGNDATTEAYFTAYIAGLRASEPGVGWSKLNTDPAKAKAAFNEVMVKLNADPKAKQAFKDAAKEYKAYNNGLMDFLAQSGAISKKKAEELKAMQYVPFYRVDKNNVELYIDDEHIVRIGNIKNQPQLKELVGSNQKIMPIYTSAMQNTAMLVDMALRNIRTKNTAYTLQKLGAVSRISKGEGPSDPNVVRFKEHGQAMHALVDTDTYGIPADLFVKSMEGIATSIPAVVRMMGIPANVLRLFVTRNPAYALRQVIRDPVQAWLATGTDAIPVLSSMKELSKMVAGRSETERKLMEAGAISSNVYTGDVRDMERFLRDVAGGKSGWEKVMAKMDAFALQGDAATRAVIFNDSLKKGMTEMQALMRTLESMNFGRRGLSPSMQMLSTLIPFFNAQIQGLDVLYRAAQGRMPQSERLNIQAKLVQRGMLLAATAVIYAALMQDDKTYKNARPEERYGNFFVRIPGVSEAVRIPIPFELGYIFKAIPEALYNTAVGSEKAKTAAEGIGKLFWQSNPFSLPQAIKPVTEAILGRSFFGMGADIESARERGLLPAERARENTSELAKLIGSVTGEAGLSPIKLEYLVRGYTGSIGVALMSVLNPLLKPPAPGGKEPEKPSMKPSQMPLFGSLFQPEDGRGLVDEAYKQVEHIRQAQTTYKNMVDMGKRAEAQAFVQRYANELALAPMAGTFYKEMGDLAKMERQITAHPTMSQPEKDARIKRIREIQQRRAEALLSGLERASDRTKRQEVPA